MSTRTETFAVGGVRSARERSLAADSTEARDDAAVAAIIEAGGTPVFEVGSRLNLSMFDLWEAFVYWLFCRVLRAPCNVPTGRGSVYTQAEAERACKTRRGYYRIMPLGSLLEEGKPQDWIAYCEPRNPKYAATLARHRVKYARLGTESADRRGFELIEELRASIESRRKETV